MPAFLIIVMEFLKKYWLYILLAFVVIYVWRKMFLGTTKIEHNYKTTGNESISKADAAALANRLFLAMDGVGTSNDVIKSVLLQVSNNLDNLRLVYNAFGTKEYGTFGSPVWGSGTPTDLKGWLHAELSGGDYASWAVLFSAANIY